MNDLIDINKVYDKNLNFLIGAGASKGIAPTLALNLKNAKGNAHTVETLAQYLDVYGSSAQYTALFMYYYTRCIEPMVGLQVNDLLDGGDKQLVYNNYRSFLEKILSILDRRKPFERRCNIFTTNYDSLFEIVSDEMMRESVKDFVLNDGGRGFTKKILDAKNLNSVVCQVGIFERHMIDIPQINLVHIHGSVFWRNDNENISLCYSDSSDMNIPPDSLADISDFVNVLNRGDQSEGDLPEVPMEQEVIDNFWRWYKKLPVVNPTKWKFHETVFEEHYYQMLRHLSYELERPNSVFITFGFSFADEHILNLMKRSLSNPTLQVFVCCFDDQEYRNMCATFSLYSNVQCVVLDDKLDFSAFNQKVFTLP